MYFVDRKKIEETLRFFEEQYDLMRSHQTWSSPLEKKRWNELFICSSNVFLIQEMI